MEITNKTTNRKFKKEKVQIGEGSLFVQLVDLTVIWEAFNSHIRKSPKYVPKRYYEPWDNLKQKEKSVQKRCTEVEIECLHLNILPTQPEHLLYCRIDLSFPLIQYKTYLVEE